MRHISPYVTGFFSGGAGIAVLSYALQNFPVKDNRWINWVIGSLQVLIGLVARGVNTTQGVNTVPLSVPPADAATTKHMQAAATKVAAYVAENGVQGSGFVTGEK